MAPMSYRILLFASLSLLSMRPVSAQSGEPAFQATAHAALAASREFDSTAAGIGGRLSWHPTRLLGVEGELTLYPGDFPRDRPFSAGLVEGLFGATVGPRLGPARAFAKVRPGFVAFREAPEPFACILIFPPPLACTLGSGRTMFALDVGGGVEWFPSGTTVIRVDAGDRMVRYPSPAIDRGGRVRRDAFFGHDVRLGIGGGVRF